MRAIRSKCLDCCAASPKRVRECVLGDCPLYLFRLGKNPNVKKREITSAEKERLLANLAKASSMKNFASRTASNFLSEGGL